MDTSTHDLKALFKQLGLPDTGAAITDFLQHHRLEHDQALADADFWSTAQRQFLHEAWQQDSDWSDAIDSLAARLRH